MTTSSIRLYSPVFDVSLERYVLHRPEGKHMLDFCHGDPWSAFEISVEPLSSSPNSTLSEIVLAEAIASDRGVMTVGAADLATVTSREIRAKESCVD